VIHAAIDGFSRLCVYLKCNSNNRAETVLKLFGEAIEQYGVPLKVRTDLGVENTLVWEVMNENCATADNPNPVITGSSVHNQRVERFNRDINRNIRSFYGDIFYDLERSQELNVESELDLAVLHYVYMPRINDSLETLRQSHNNHPMRCENNKTPLQMAVSSQQTALQANTLDNSDNSIQELSPPSDDSLHYHVKDLLDESGLFNAVNIDSATDIHGITLYRNAKQYVLQQLT